jgi:hypothetical protein
MRFEQLLPSAAFSILVGLPISQVTASEVDAAGYYMLRCATCHGVNGEGTRDRSPSLGPPLRGNPLVINAPVEMLMSIIRDGRGGQQRVYDDAYPNMPAFDAGMVPDPIGLATYLKTVLQQQEKASNESGSASPDSNGDEELVTTPAQVVATEPDDANDMDREVTQITPHPTAGAPQLQIQFNDPAHQSPSHRTK